jgi:hypothetical protein
MRVKLFNVLAVCVFISAIIMLYPINRQTYSGDHFGEIILSVILSIYNTIQLFILRFNFTVIQESASFCPPGWDIFYLIWGALLFVLAPAATFGFVASLFQNLSSYVRYGIGYFNDTYIFSELNEKSLSLASDIKKNHPKAIIVFADTDDNGVENADSIERAREIHALFFKKDITVPKFGKRSKKKFIKFFLIGQDEDKNLIQSIKIIKQYKERKKTDVYVFSKKAECELALSSVIKQLNTIQDANDDNMKIRRIDEVRSLIHRTLYDDGKRFFDNAKENEIGTKTISAVIVGMGYYGTEMLKSLAWFGQMEGYFIEINGFDKDKSAEQKMKAQAPELLSPEYNGLIKEGEAQYRITIHSDVDVNTITFADRISEIKNATYVLVSLGSDEENIRTAVNLRMYFTRMGIHPVIQAVVYDAQRRQALEGVLFDDCKSSKKKKATAAPLPAANEPKGLCNFKGQLYNIEFIGGIEASYNESVILLSNIEKEALAVHTKWGTSESFWNYEYNYNSSMASAIHMNAKIVCGIPGADKAENELTEEQKQLLGNLEHRRWKAYMRANGYIYHANRNDIGKMHPDLNRSEEHSKEQNEKTVACATK